MAISIAFLKFYINFYICCIQSAINAILNLQTIALQILPPHYIMLIPPHKPLPHLNLLCARYYTDF